jgi:uncharacterized protein (DUF4415 family)
MSMKKTGKDIETSARAREHGLRRIPRRHLTEPGEATLKDAKVRVTIYLDADVLAYFKNRATKANAARYQTQINNELRAVLERDHNADQYADLVNDERFIESVALKVKQAEVAQSPGGESSPATSNAAVVQNIKFAVFQSPNSLEKKDVELWTGANSNTGASRTTKANTTSPTAEAA